MGRAHSFDLRGRVYAAIAEGGSRRAAARRFGVGAALLADSMDRARAAGAAALFVDVAADNAGALALYRRAGFVQVGRRPGYYAAAAGAQDALILRAALTAAHRD